MIPASGQCPEEGNGNTLQYSFPGNLRDGGAWLATVHRVAKIQARLGTPTMPIWLSECWQHDIYLWVRDWKTLFEESNRSMRKAHRGHSQLLTMVQPGHPSVKLRINVSDTFCALLPSPLDLSCYFTQSHSHYSIKLHTASQANMIVSCVSLNSHKMPRY